MFVVCVTSWVKPEHIEDYKKACEANRNATRKEPNNLRFDFLQHTEHPNQFFFYEVYHEEADFKYHHQQPHFITWRDTVSPWMEKPREGMRYNSLAPGETDAEW